MGYEAGREEMSYQLDNTLRLIEEKNALKAENEALLKGLRGKNSLVGATYEHLINEKDCLKNILSNVLDAITPVSNTAYNLGQSHEQWDIIRQSVSELDDLRTQAYKLLKGNK